MVYTKTKEVSDLEIRQLKYFLAVADHRSFGAAAESLFVTRQAVSKSISQLEEELKLDLFHRESNGVYLTPAGMKFYDYVKHLVAEYDKVQNEMMEYGNSYSQNIRVSFAIGITKFFEFSASSGSHANLKIHIDELPDSELKIALLDRHADLAIGSSFIDDPNFTSTEVIKSEIGILAGANWNDYNILDRGTLRTKTLACIKGDGALDRFCESNKLDPLFRGFDYMRLMKLAKESRCGLLIPRYMALNPIHGLKWYSIAGKPEIKIYISHLRSTENNMLLWSAVEEIRNRILKTVDLVD